MKTYDIWLASRFAVEADSDAAAADKVAAWLTATLTASTVEANGIAVTRPAQFLVEPAVLALQLVAIERKGGEVATEQICRLRDEVRRIEQCNPEHEIISDGRRQ